MAYSCYVRHEGRDLIEVEPTITIRFDQLTTVTRNRLRRMFQDNYCPYGYRSKPHAILAALQGHYGVFMSLLDPKLMAHPNFDEELFAAKALLTGYRFEIIRSKPPHDYYNGRGYLSYCGDLPYDKRGPELERVEKLKEDTLIPIARSLIDHNKLAPIMDALENHQPYTFTGVNMR